jgi:hypothetical protein
MTPQVDPIVPSGSPATVTLPLTGHVLSLSIPGESSVGYVTRVSTQCGVPDWNIVSSKVGAIQGAAYHFPTNRADWPAAADKFWNPEAYLTPAEKAAEDAGQDKWSAAQKAENDAAGGVARPQPDGTTGHHKRHRNPGEVIDTGG